MRLKVGEPAGAEGHRATGEVGNDAGDDLEKGRFAGPVGAENDDDLVLVDDKVDAGERAVLAVGGADAATIQASAPPR